jgi:hypothetical protein
MNTGGFSMGWSGRGVKFITSLHLVPSLRMSGATFYSPYTPSWHKQGQSDPFFTSADELYLEDLTDTLKIRKYCPLISIVHLIWCRKRTAFLITTLIVLIITQSIKHQCNMNVIGDVELKWIDW